MEDDEGPALLLLMQRSWCLLILPQVRVVLGKVTGSAAVVTDDLTFLSILVITSGGWWQGGEIGSMLAWLVLLTWVSLPIR